MYSSTGSQLEGHQSSQSLATQRHQARSTQSSIEDMASATGIPESSPAGHGRGEDEPLLGRAGDASQPEGKGLQFNLVIGKTGSTIFGLLLLILELGTAIIAQAGIWIVCLVALQEACPSPADTGS